MIYLDSYQSDQVYLYISIVSVQLCDAVQTIISWKTISSAIVFRTLVKSAYPKIIFLFLNQNICCGYSKERSQ